MNTSSETVTAILQAAQAITQEVGYNGLSFRDVAAKVGIKSASVHYHFPTKGKLGAAIARRYTEDVIARVEQLNGLALEPNDVLARYAAGMRETLEQTGRMCLGGMLAAEIDALPEEVRAEVRRYVDLNVDGLAKILARGSGQTIDAERDRARALFAALEGAMLIARGTGDLASFDTMTEQFRVLGLLRC